MPTSTPTLFAARVRAEMAAQGLSVRGLARKIDPNNLDRVRRNLHRWLDDGMSPHRANREEVAVALGLDEHALDDDEEESDPVADLLHAIRRIVRDELRSERGDVAPAVVIWAAVLLLLATGWTL